MACTSVFDAFRYATEDLDQQVSRTASYRSIWMNLMQSGTYPKNVGTNRSVFAIGNVEPTSGDGTWAPIDLSNQLGSPGDPIDTPNELCTNDWQDVEYGFNEATYGPEISQLRGPVICQKDLLFSHDPDTFLGGYIEEIAKRAKREWELWIQQKHIAMSRKAIAVPDFAGSFADQAALTGLECATCELTQEMLEIVAQYLNEDGATTPDSNGYITWEEAGPTWSLYIGQSQSARLLRQNAELRNDYRYADPNTLIARIGANRVIGNFRHMIAQRPRRYSCVDGDYTLVQPYVNDSMTKGTGQIINPAWRAAPYEGADVLSPLLFTKEVVPPTNSAGGVNFDSKNYMGEWDFVTGAYKWDDDCEDPLEDRGRHYAEFIAAAKPNLAARFKYGYHIIFQRCAGNLVECTTCSSS